MLLLRYAGALVTFTAAATILVSAGAWITSDQGQPIAEFILEWLGRVGLPFFAVLGAFLLLADGVSPLTTPTRYRIALVVLTGYATWQMLAADVPGYRNAGAAFLVAALLITAIESRRWHRRRHRTCPDCAETVKTAANVCRHCGYRFDGPTQTFADI